MPVFPLPGTVLFPQTTLPLHVFELRYRTMVRDALSRGRLIVLTLLKPGWEADYHGSPEFHALGCLARFEEVEWLPNDCYDLRVLGLERVQITRIVQEFPYRAAHVESLTQHPYTEDDPFVQMEKHELVLVFERLLVALGVTTPFAHVDRSARFEALVNTLCAGSDLSSAERLDLLAIDSIIERGQRIRELTERRLRQGVARRVLGTGGPRGKESREERGGERN